jgi:hypothetical protein
MNREKVFFTGRTCDPLGGHEITGCLLNGSNPNRDGATVFLAAKVVFVLLGDLGFLV